ncbi:MAG: 6-hydroxymethylpterin diphosphokinase MptE-like protein [Myxococcota bacterium]
MSQRVFEQNRAVLRRRNPALVAALDAASDDAVERVTGPRGDVVLRESGVLLGSAYDPRRDGERLAEQMAASPADIVVAVGIGLGEQIEAFCARSRATVVVYEPSLARLRAALSRVSIVNLLNTHRDVHFVADLDQLTAIVNGRYVPGLCLRVFPHPAVMRLDPAAVAEAVERTKRVKDAADTRISTSVGQLVPWAWIVADNGRRIAESADFGRLAGSLRGVPAVIAAAGPSLDKQLPLLKAWRDRVAVIAIGQTLKALRQAGIEPDLVHILESSDVSHQLIDAGDTRDLCVALTPDAHAAIYDVPVRARFTATTGGSPMGGWIAKATGGTQLTMGGGTVAQGAVGLAVLLGCSPILLIGQDLAFTDGRAYAKGSAYDFVQIELAEDGTCSISEMNRKAALLKRGDRAPERDKVDKGRIVWVDGWNPGEKVATWRAYAAFIEQYREIGVGLARRGYRLINCTEGGARIPMVEHQPFDQALEAGSGTPVDVRKILLEAYDDRPERPLGAYRDALRQGRRRLDEIEREVERARTFERDARDRVARVRSDQQRVELLRGIARCEKRIREQLVRAPWLDALVQPEIYAAIATQRRTENRSPSVEALFEEARFLIEAAAHGVERGRAWFDRFEASFGDPVDAAASAEDARARRGAAARARPVSTDGDDQQPTPPAPTL